VRPSAARALAWLVPTATAAVAVAVLELCFVIPVFPTAASSITGLLLTLVAVARLFVLVALPLAFVGMVLERIRRLAVLPDPSWALAAFITVIGVTIALHTFQAFVTSLQLDFEQTRAGISTVAVFGVVSTAVVALRFVLEPLVRIVLAHMPSLGSPRGVAVFVLACLSVLLLITGHAIFAPVHKTALAAAAGAGSVALTLLAARIAAPRPGLRWGMGASFVIAILLGSTPFDRDPFARFVTMRHAATAGPLGIQLRDLLDRDGDSASPTWALGGDCAEGDGTRGPTVVEKPANGIDDDCAGGDAPAVPPVQGPGSFFPGCTLPPGQLSILLMTVDALRNDAINPRVAPNVTQAAAVGMRFTRAYSPSCMTGASLASLFTGRAVSDLAVNNVITDETLQHDKTFAEVLHAAGYRTAAFNHFHLNATVRLGFEELNSMPIDVLPRKGMLLSAGLANSVLSFVLKPDPRPFFVWVHFPDTHAPYVFNDGLRLSPAQQPLSAYERGVQYVDGHVGRVLQTLAQRGVAARTIVVLSADHGEDLGRRGREGHGPNLFEEATHVPLVLWIPGCAPRALDQPVSLTHLAATLGAIVGVPFAGQTFLPGGFDPAMPTVVEETPISDLGFVRAVIHGHHKLLVDEMNGGRLLFDLQDDPGEVVDISREQPNVLAEMQRSYQLWLDRPGAR